MKQPKTSETHSSTELAERVAEAQAEHPHAAIVTTKEGTTERISHIIPQWDPSWLQQKS